MSAELTIPHSLRVDPEEALRRDFTKLIPALNAVGFSNCKLAYRCKVSESVIRKWAKGETEPVYSVAIILIALFDIYCARERQRTLADSSVNKVSDAT